jgi:hypothetical protein
MKVAQAFRSKSLAGESRSRATQGWPDQWMFDKIYYPVHPPPLYLMPLTMTKVIDTASCLHFKALTLHFFAGVNPSATHYAT